MSHRLCRTLAIRRQGGSRHPLLAPGGILAAAWRRLVPPALLVMLAAMICPAGVVGAASFDIPAWAFDRGNAATFTDTYADAGPMVAFGGQSPVVVEYDVPLPEAGRYRLEVCYAAADARLVECLIDGRPVGPVCRTATGSWNTSGAAWELSAELDLTAGTHTLRFQRNTDFPHVVGLRFGSDSLPPGYAPSRPKARVPASRPAAAAAAVVAGAAARVRRARTPRRGRNRRPKAPRVARAPRRPSPRSSCGGS